MRVTVEDARKEHLEPMLDDIRLADLKEWYAGTGHANLEQSLKYVWESDRYARVALAPDGVGLAMWGIDTLEDGSGHIWLFATDRAVPAFLDIHRHLKAELGAIMQRWPTVKAYSDSRNTLHHRWLEWCGFEFLEEVHLKPFGLPFKKYQRTTPCA